MLLGRLLRAELRSASSVGLNNFFFCILILLAGSSSPGQVRDAFFTTLLFQLVLLVPLLVTFSVDTFNRLPDARMLLLPVSRTRRLLLSTVSLLANPLFLLMLVFYSAWVGLATATALLMVAGLIHALVALVRGLRWPFRTRLRSPMSRLPGSLSGLAFAHLLELMGTLDLWAALLVALAGTAYRVSGSSRQADAFPILALMVAAAMSTVPQRMLSLDGGRAAMRYRLLPLAGWRLLLVLDLMYLAVVVLLSAPLDAGAASGFALVAIAVGRYPALTQDAPQRRGRFTSGDPRYGVVQILAGGLAGLGCVRVGPLVLVVAVVVYAGSLVWGGRTWMRRAPSKVG